jgi:hypothetical protein
MGKVTWPTRENLCLAGHGFERKKETAKNLCPLRNEEKKNVPKNYANKMVKTYFPVAGKWPTDEIKMGIRCPEKSPSPRKWIGQHVIMKRDSAVYSAGFTGKRHSTSLMHPLDITIKWKIRQTWQDKWPNRCNKNGENNAQVSKNQKFRIYTNLIKRSKYHKKPV